jgi:hypothetical protein
MAEIAAREALSAGAGTTNEQTHRRVVFALVVGIIGVLAPYFVQLAIEGPDGRFGAPKGLSIGAIALRAGGFLAFRGVWSLVAILLGRTALAMARAAGEESDARLAYAATVLGWVGLAGTGIALIRTVFYLSAADPGFLQWLIDWRL